MKGTLTSTEPRLGWPRTCDKAPYYVYSFFLNCGEWQGKDRTQVGQWNNSKTTFSVWVCSNEFRKQTDRPMPCGSWIENYEWHSTCRQSKQFEIDLRKSRNHRLHLQNGHNLFSQWNAVIRPDIVFCSLSTKVSMAQRDRLRPHRVPFMQRSVSPDRTVRNLASYCTLRSSSGLLPALHFTSTPHSRKGITSLRESTGPLRLSSTGSFARQSSAIAIDGASARPTLSSSCYKKTESLPVGHSSAINRDFPKQNNVPEKYSFYVKTQFFWNSELIRIIWVVTWQVGYFETKVIS
jgi:hypothetical protein